MQISLVTPRLLIRELTFADAETIWRFNQSEANRRYEPDPPQTLPEFEDVMLWIVGEQTMKPRSAFYVGVTLRQQPDLFLGSVHISIRDHFHQQAEVGYSFDSAYWGNGYCTEASHAMVNFAFHTLGMHRVYADSIVSENRASVRVAEKLGMVKEAHHRETFFFHGRWWDSLTYSILADEWRAKFGI